MTSPPPPPGKVYFVGAGPGDPGLLTVRGAACLAQADLVLYDYLVNPRLLGHLRPGTEAVCLGRHGQGRLLGVGEIVNRMLAAARQGQTVVRLKSGDPTVFARATEETSALAAAGVPFEIVPGITAALAAGSYAGLALTDRESASAVALITGQQRLDEPDPLDYRALAAFPGTLVFYMGVTTVRHWTGALIAAGAAAETPVAAIRRCSWPDQTVHHTTLAGLADLVARERLRPPVIFVVGAVAEESTWSDWFARRPLGGRRVLVTRPRDQGLDVQARLAELGADVLTQPAIEILPPADPAALDAALARLDAFDWLVFSSVHGVRSVLTRLWALGGDARRLGGLKLAVIGPATAAEMERFQLRADRTPGEFLAEALAAELAVEARGKRFLLVRASRGREVLAETLRAAGGIVEQVVAYQSEDTPRPDPEVAEELAAGRVDWITVSSSAIARSLVRLFGDELRKARLASISPITSATLRELGHSPAAEAAVYTMPGLIDAILAAEGAAGVG